MGEIQFQNINWDNLERDATPEEVKHIEKRGWAMTFAVVLAVLSVGIVVREMMLTQTEILSVYSETIPWVNRCSKACQEQVNIGYLESVDECTALQQLYDQEAENQLLNWRQAVDDRASYMGCAGFPKTQATIEEDTRIVLEKQQAQREEAIRVQVEETRKHEAAKLPRFEQAVFEGELKKFILQTERDEQNPLLMRVTLKANWFTQKQSLQEQMATVMWQKWVNVAAPRSPESVRLQFLAPDGYVVGQDSASSPGVFSIAPWSPPQE